MICGVVATSISSCGVCSAVPCSVRLSHTTRHAVHTSYLENKGENCVIRTIISTIQKYQMREAEIRRRLAAQTELSADLG